MDHHHPTLKDHVSNAESKVILLENATLAPKSTTPVGLMIKMK